MKIICIGRNYVAHIKELGNQIPAEPVLFIKPKSALVVQNHPFYYPEFTNELHYEAELVVKIIKNGKYITKDVASMYYNQITVGIDFTARDIQNQLKENGLPWEKAKAFDGSAAVGTFINIADLPNTNDINFGLKLNGAYVQQASSNQMIYSIAAIIEEASKYFTLNIGDLIYTGTPAGVGECVTGDLLEGYVNGQQLLKIEVN